MREYEDNILEAANEVIPNRRIKVGRHDFKVEYITRGEAIALGRLLAKTKLWKYHIDAPKLFIGEEMED